MLFANDLRHALDGSAFAREALGIGLDQWQETVLTTASKRLMLNVSRQGGKSTIAATKALHRAHFVPGSLILMVSPSLRQSGELYRKWRDLADRLPALSLTEDTKTSCTLKNGSRVVSLPSSEGTVRGYSAVDLLLLDEASRVTDELYGACRPMVAVSGGAIIAMSTPAGERGFWHDAWTNGGDAWQRVEVPASMCPRISPAFLAEERAALPERVFRAEYCCSFEAIAGGVFRAEDLALALENDVEPLFKEAS